MDKKHSFDEMTGFEGDALRQPYDAFSSWFTAQNPSRLRKKQREADALFRLTGITFNVYTLGLINFRYM
jgi:uncharacterized circularly permuted ATP-grasp superfamily protein